MLIKRPDLINNSHYRVEMKVKLGLTQNQEDQLRISANRKSFSSFIHEFRISCQLAALCPFVRCNTLLARLRIQEREKFACLFRKGSCRRTKRILNKILITSDLWTSANCIHPPRQDFPFLDGCCTLNFESSCSTVLFFREIYRVWLFVGSFARSSSVRL